jgi:hypothetical protein
VSNPGPDEAFSVHVYAPPLGAITFYDPSPDGFLAPLAITTGDLVAIEGARP